MLKNKKGITLVALIVTIIILLILAGVSIETLTNSGLFEKAKIAKEKSKETQEKEEQILIDYENRISSVTSKRDINEEEIEELINQIVQEKVNMKTGSPTGSLISYMGTIAPEGYLICDGTEYNISDYKTLAEQIKVNFGMYNYYGGDGITTFAVPNLIGKFLKGENSNIGVVENAGLPNITGSFGVMGNGALGSYFCINRTQGAFYKSSLLKVTGDSYTSTYNSNIAYDGVFDASRCSAIYGKSTTVTPENMSVLYCIKY